mmetsp:Transcript_2843/g.6768  ORF Transcript_2843/g.6768 Transcript_2843/m.6768 type:complete len:109 (-) Transcript_2843:194-520(-)
MGAARTALSRLVHRYLDARARGLEIKHPFAEWSPGVRKAMLLCLAYFAAMPRGGRARRAAHWYLTAVAVLSAVTDEVAGVSALGAVDNILMAAWRKISESGSPVKKND